MNTRLLLVFGIIGVVAAILLFAASPIIATHQAWAWGGYYDGCGYGCGGYVYGGSGFYSYPGGGGFYSYGGIGW
jgi:hypothetical protein